MRFLFILFFISLTAQAQDVKWPNLNSYSYVSGRVAKEADIGTKSAIFVLKSNGKYIGTPINITLPQYALYTDGKTKKITRVVVIQAESEKGMNMYGAVNIRDGKSIVSIDKDFKLLGKQRIIYN